MTSNFSSSIEKGEGSWWLLYQILEEGFECQLGMTLHQCITLKAGVYLATVHSSKSESKVISSVMLLKPTHERRSRGQPKKGYIKSLTEHSEQVWRHHDGFSAMEQSRNVKTSKASKEEN